MLLSWYGVLSLQVKICKKRSKLGKICAISDIITFLAADRDKKKITAWSHNTSQNTRNSTKKEFLFLCVFITLFSFFLPFAFRVRRLLELLTLSSQMTGFFRSVQLPLTCSSPQHVQLAAPNGHQVFYLFEERWAAEYRWVILLF